MRYFELTNEEKNRLQKLNGDKTVIFALKKLFLNVCVNDPPSNESIKKIIEAFHNLETIKPDDRTGIEEKNPV